MRPRWSSRVALVAVLLGSGCVVSPSLLGDKPCPCADGFQCVDDRCEPGPALDSGALDAGSLDAGRLDAGAFDAGSLDAGVLDSGRVDAGPLDSGSAEGGPPLDAGPPGPVAHFDCESSDGLRILDVSGNGFHGGCDGAGCPRIVPGRVGMGCDFTSDDRRLRLPANQRFVPGDPSGSPEALTVALWINLHVTDPIREGSAIGLPVGSATANTWQLFVSASGGVLRPGFVSADVTGIRSFFAPPVSAGQWMHATLTFDGFAKVLYLDGLEVGRREGEGPLSFGARGVTIGADENGGGELALPLDGMLDEILIYDRVLSTAEITALANP